MPPTPQAGPPVEEEPEEPAPPTVVSEELVVEMLRETNGRMASSQLIANLQPLDKAGQRALASMDVHMGSASPPSVYLRGGRRVVGPGW